MKKKGFTLVELLAVIAILAILVIIALPNVMGMFNQAKQNSFTTEVKEIFKQAEQQWISDSMINTQEITYYRIKGYTGASTGNGIQLTGRTQLDYFIKVNKSGKIVEYYATDGSYQYIYIGDGLLVEQIDDGKTLANQGIKYASNDFDTEVTTTPVLVNNKVYQVSTFDAAGKELFINRTVTGGVATITIGLK